MTKHKVLSTKKLESSLIEQAKQSGVEISEQEFIAIKPICTKEKQDEVLLWALSRDVHYVVFTSANAVEAVKNYLRDGANGFAPNWKVFCISGRTKAALQPFVKDERIVATAEYGKHLAQKIVASGVKEVVFFCGNKRRDELPAILKNAGIQVQEIVVYETIETPAPVTVDADAVLFFSPSAVQSFFTANQLKKNTVCFAIGTTTADAIKDFAGNKIIISDATSQESLLASVQLYFEGSTCSE